VSDLFAERFAAVRQRFAAKLDARIDEIEAKISELDREISQEALAHAHRRAHDLCGVGPTMGFVATGQAARSIEQVLHAAIKSGRTLTGDEAARVRDGIARLRSAAIAENSLVPGAAS
jgi:HPt (histidine-containing phosphotransfer) domain-containing protein